MDESRAAEDYGWLKEPLPEAPPLRPLRRWTSERPVIAFVTPFLPLLAVVSMVSLFFAGLGFPELETLVFAALGATCLIALTRRAARRRRAAACRRFASEPWKHDRAWNERGVTRSWLVRMAAAVQPRSRPLLAVTLVLLMWGVLALTGSRRLVGALMICAGLIWPSLVAWRIHGMGDTRLTYSKFPFHPGERVTLFFGMSDGGAQFRRAEFRLFHAREFRDGTLGLQRGTEVGVAIREHHPPSPLPGPDFDVEVAFNVPDDAMGTRLTDDLPQYWVLEVRGSTTAGPYFERFLVPIYERPAVPLPEGAA